MSRKRAKKHHPKQRQAVPEEILAEGSGPHGEAEAAALAQASVDAGVEVEGDAEAAELDAAAVEAPVMAEDGTLAVSVVQPAIEAAESARGKGKRRGKRAAAEPEVVAVEAAPEAVEAAPEAVEAAEAEAVAEVEVEVVAADEAVSESDPADAPLAASAVDGEMEGMAAELGEDGELAEDAELGAALPTSAASMDDPQLKHLVEALVFASDKPVTLLRLRQLTRVADVRRLEGALAQLATDFADRGLILQQVSGGYQFRTQTRYSAWVQQLIAGRPVRLSRAQLETLAIIAYRQPITRPEIDEIRGVDSSGTLKVLLDRALVRVLGKREEVGRPMLYGTTKEFLDFFSLGDLRELPTLREYSELTPESKRVMTDKLGPQADEAPPAAVLAEGSGAITADAELGAEESPAESPAETQAETQADIDALVAEMIGAEPGEVHVTESDALRADVEPAAESSEAETMVAVEDTAPVPALEAVASEPAPSAIAEDAGSADADDELADPDVLAEAVAVARALAADHDDVDTEIAAAYAGDDLDAAPSLDPSEDLLADPDPGDEIAD